MPDGRPRDTSEAARVAALIASLPTGERVIVGPGDDAAVIRPREGHDLVVTTDSFVEGRHFRRDLLTASEIGGRLAAANLSDLAAMAATPRWAVLALVLPASWSAGDMQLLERGCARALQAEGAAIVGGNLASDDVGFSATMTLLGEVEHGRAWTRVGARPGDVLAVSGVPGSAAAFAALALWGNPPSRARVPSEITERFIAPVSRVSAARALADMDVVHAAIDSSDGLAADVARLASASGVGARIEDALLPADQALRAAARMLSATAGQERGLLPAGEGALLSYLQLGSSDDYELLLAVDPERWEDAVTMAASHGMPLTRIGAFTAGAALERVDRSGETCPLDPRGWDHFAG